MSRTDVHRPWRVQAADPHNRHRLYRTQPYGIITALHGPEVVLAPLYNTCGCPMCSGRYHRREQRRRDRHTWRARLRREARADGE